MGLQCPALLLNLLPWRRGGIHKHSNQFVLIQVGLWLPLSAILGGTVAVLLGGGLGDLLAVRGGAKARLAILGSALVLSSPLAAGTLYLEPPLAFASLLGYYLLGMYMYYLLGSLIDPKSILKPTPPQLKPGSASSSSPWWKSLLRG